MSTELTKQHIKENLQQISTKLTLRESEINREIDQLDPKSWLVQYKGQFSEPDGRFIQILDKENKPIAAVIVTPAEKSQFQQFTKLTHKALKNCAYISAIWVSDTANFSNALTAILYFALRRGRIWGRQNVVSLIPIPNPRAPLATLMKLDALENVPELTLDGQKYLAVAQQISYAIHNVYYQCQDDELELIKAHFTNEVIETHRRWLDRFYHGSWSQSILDGEMTKQQYINSLYNLHEYVRQTTRLAARCIAHSEDPALRNHYINHFRGEINHELLIERDLKHLGADVEYLKESHIPSQATKEFMVVQESTSGFYQDPILMLACPMAAEGVAANMRPDFIKALIKRIESWGVEKPKEAARFLTSHVNTDGGDDGHWINVIKMIQKYVKNEHDMQKFLSVLTAAMNGFERGFNANIEDLQVWSAFPQGTTRGVRRKTRVQ